MRAGAVSYTKDTRDRQGLDDSMLAIVDLCHAARTISHITACT